LGFKLRRMSPAKNTGSAVPIPKGREDRPNSAFQWMGVSAFYNVALTSPHPRPRIPIQRGAESTLIAVTGSSGAESGKTHGSGWGKRCSIARIDGCLFTR
jgi:hypothetical protein